MGYEHVELALESTRYKGVEKAVIVALCDFINNERAKEGDTVVWPGMKTLCRITGWSKSPVQRAIDNIVAGDNPAIEIVTVGKGQESTRYRVHLDRLGGSSQPIPPQPTVDGGSGEPIPEVAESPHPRSGDLPSYGRRATGVVAESYPNQEYNQQSTIKENQKEEVEEESASASSDFSNPQNSDVMEEFKKHSVETELIPIAKSYNINANCREEATKLYEVLEEVHFAGCHLVAAIEYFRCISDTFMADRISTWPGLLKMLRSGGMIQQFRSAQHLASNLNPTAYQKAQADSFGTPAYGAAVAKIIGDKKAGKKSNPAHGNGKHVS
jgi:hypothetical protein